MRRRAGRAVEALPVVVAGVALAFISGASWGCGDNRDTRARPATAQTEAKAPRDAVHMRPAVDDEREVVVSGLAMSSVSGVVRRECRQTAETVGYPVLCPRYLPSEAFADLRFCGEADRRQVIGTGCGRSWRHWEFSTVSFPGDSVVPEGHLIIQAAPRHVGPAGFIHGPAGVPEHPGISLRRQKARIKQGWTGRWVVASKAYGSAFNGHTVLVWDVDGRTYGLGFHATGAASRRLALWLARHSTLVAPR